MRLDIGGGGANGDDDILPITSFEKNINKQAQNIALLEVALAFGFDDPFNQADSKSSKGSLDQGKLDLAHKNYLKVTSGPKVAENYCCKKHDGDHNGVMCCENVVMSAGAFLSENWHLRPTKIDLSRSDKKKRYEEERANDISATRRILSMELLRQADLRGLRAL